MQYEPLQRNRGGPSPSFTQTQHLMASNGTMDCVCFTLIVDDIVQPDGRTLMCALGGGGELD